MKTSIRQSNATLILDLYGEWPQSDSDLLRLREEMDQTLAGHVGPLIWHIHDAEITSSLQLGVLIAATKGVREATCGFLLAVVSPSRRLRDVFNVSDSRVPAFETEKEALCYIRERSRSEEK